MIIELGKYYRDAAGMVFGPMKKCRHQLAHSTYNDLTSRCGYKDEVVFMSGDMKWTEDGKSHGCEDVKTQEVLDAYLANGLKQYPKDHDWVREYHKRNYSVGMRDKPRHVLVAEVTVQDVSPETTARIEKAVAHMLGRAPEPVVTGSERTKADLAREAGLPT